MYPLARVVASSAVIAASLAGVSLAHAQDPKNAPDDTDKARLPRESQEDPRKPIAVTVNPLGLAIERYGANLEVSPVAHHAFVGSLYAQAIPVWLVKSVVGRNEINQSDGSSIGGELGYRLYSGTRGSDGLFVGGSFVSMPLAYPRLASDLASADLVRFNALGAALDIGVQKVTSSGFTLGGGVGVMYLDYQVPNDLRRLPIAFEPHVLPRLLLAAGYAF
jgi:hypothetical protein